ncbi:MAG TPA: zinc-binding dehydrogenase [Terriglobia bacterium]|nr:zinc-binding dehydrogenase [Terriglobia bacterium]
MDTKNGMISRRGLLTTGVVAAGSAALVSKSAPIAGQAPAVVTARRFRGWVTRGGGTNRTTLQELTLRPVTGRQLVVRTEATNLCYSNVGSVLGLQGNAGGPGGAGAPRGGQAPGGRGLGPGGAGAGARGFVAAGQGGAPAGAGRGGPGAGQAGARGGGGGFGGGGRALIQGHGGVGIVEAVGPDVRRVQVGDRVCVSGTPQCGSCYQCLRGRSDMCQFLMYQTDLFPIADMSDGTPVFANSLIGGLAELMVTNEEWVVPIFTKATAADLGMVCSCVAVAGLGATTSPNLALVQPASTVAVVGCGPLGLSAIQGARIAGASTIIAIDPIRARRELALKVGATHAIDPNNDGNVIQLVRDLSKGPNNRLWSGGRESAGALGNLLGGAGPDFVIEAAGADAVTPRLEPSPDPTGILALQQAYQMCSAGGHIVTTSLPRGNITLSAALFAIGGRTHHAGQAGGSNPMRDIPRYVEMLDRKQFDSKSLATTVVPIEGMIEAYEQVAYRTTVTAIMTA